MKKLFALAVIMAALGAAGAMIALRLLSRPRVAPAPYGPGTPLPTPGDLSGDSDALPDERPLAEPERSWSASEWAVATDAFGAAVEREPELSDLETLEDVRDESITDVRDEELDAPSLASEAEADDFASAQSMTSEEQAAATAFEPDATDEVPSHHVPPAVSDVVGEPVRFDADVFDVEPSHVPPAPVSEVTGEHTEAVFEAEEALAVPVTEAISHVAEAAEESSAEEDGDFLTNYFNQLADTPPTEAPAPEPAAEAPAFEYADDKVDQPLPASVEEALATLPHQDIAALGRRDAESYLDEGNVYFNVGQYGLAIERYGKAIELDPDLTAAFYNRANARTRAGEYEGALSDYDRALLLQPQDADALNNRGMLHLYRASYGDALSDFNAALSIDPSDTTVMVNRGLAQLHGGDAAAALVDFQSATSLDGSDAAAHYGAAQAAAALENRAESLRHLARAFEIDPGYAREAAADPKLQPLQGDDDFMRLLRESGSRAER